jgi:arginine decarboxylase-like protein
VLGGGGEFELRNVRCGEQAGHALAYFGFDEQELVDCVAGGLRARVDGGTIDTAEAAALLEDYRRRLRHYTYLD